MKHIKKFQIFEKVIVGDFVDNGSKMVIDILPPDDEYPEYIEYLAYGVDDEKFYLLDPDFEVVMGPFDSREELDDNL